MPPRPPAQLRSWQQQALEQFLGGAARDWLTCATPGAGKTTYALAAAATLWSNGHIDRVVVVCPTDHLRRQWMAAAASLGFDLRDTANDERIPADADGYVATYAQVAQRPQVHAGRVGNRRSFVIFDEIHHAGEQMSWGGAVMEAFEAAVCRFGITGTPFRSDSARIAHVRYEPTGDGAVQSRAHFDYGYGDALRDGVVRPVTFVTYSAQTSWSTSAGETRMAVLGRDELTREAEEAAWRTALDPDGEWMPHVMAAAWARVQELRASTIPAAKVLIPASSQQVARHYAEVWQSVTGDRAEVILSDDPGSADRLARYRDDPQVVCAVCVRLITEGVDVPDAAVLVYSTTASTPLFFAQMVGRVIRARRRSERATVFLPAVARLLGLAAEMERARDHVIQDLTETGEGQEPADVDDVAEDELSDREEDDDRSWRPLASQASLRDVLSTVSTAGGDGLFELEGLLTPEEEKALLGRAEHERAEAARRVAAERKAVRDQAERQRLQDLVDQQWSGQAAETPPAAADRGDVRQLRATMSSLVSVYAGQEGLSHQQAWAALYRRSPGPKNAAATREQLQQRLQILRGML